MAHSFLPPLSSYSVKLTVQFQKLALVLWNFICAVSKQRLQAYVIWWDLLWEHDEVGLSPKARTHRSKTSLCWQSSHRFPCPPALVSNGWSCEAEHVFLCSVPCNALSHSEIKVKSLELFTSTRVYVIHSLSPTFSSTLPVHSAPEALVSLLVLKRAQKAPSWGLVLAFPSDWMLFTPVSVQLPPSLPWTSAQCHFCISWPGNIEEQFFPIVHIIW